MSDAHVIEKVFLSEVDRIAAERPDIGPLAHGILAAAVLEIASDSRSLHAFWRWSTRLWCGKCTGSPKPGFSPCSIATPAHSAAAIRSAPHHECTGLSETAYSIQRLRTPMYLFLDISPDRLVGGTRFLFWAMRGWVNSLARDRCPAATLSPAFIRKGLGDVLSDFHKVMFVVHHREYRRIPFAERGTADITEFEAVMLSLWSDIAEGATEQARATLKTFMDENWVEDSVGCMGRITACMAARGIAPSRNIEPAE